MKITVCDWCDLKIDGRVYKISVSSNQSNEGGSLVPYINYFDICQRCYSDYFEKPESKIGNMNESYKRIYDGNKDTKQS